MNDDGKIYSYGSTASGVRVKRGFYAVDPNGHCVLLPVHSAIKPGWRVAMQHDIEPKAKQAPVVPPVAAIEPSDIAPVDITPFFDTSKDSD